MMWCLRRQEWECNSNKYNVHIRTYSSLKEKVSGEHTKSKASFNVLSSCNG